MLVSRVFFKSNLVRQRMGVEGGNMGRGTDETGLGRS